MDLCITEGVLDTRELNFDPIGHFLGNVVFFLPVLEENGFEQRNVILLGIREVVNKFLRLCFLFFFRFILAFGPMCGSFSRNDDMMK